MRYLILGGTGTLGKALTKELLKTSSFEVICFSRCELKQKEMKTEFGYNPKLSFFLGDIRDKEALNTALSGIDVVFHVAALKHIDVLEDNPEESVRTNVLGTINVADAAISNRVKHVVFSSTDKAVDPINVYGMSKGISEKILFRRNELQNTTRFSVFRWGNVVGSRGSVIPYFVKSLLETRSVSVTNENMTRFWLPIEEAVSFMLKTYPKASKNEPCIPSIKAAPLMKVITIIADILGIDHFKINEIGMRKGEKLHEALRSRHTYEPIESCDAEQYTDKEIHDLVLPIVLFTKSKIRHIHPARKVLPV